MHKSRRGTTLSIRNCVTAVALTLALCSPLAAQSEAAFQFYHGSGGTSRIAVDNDGKEVRNGKRKFDLVLAPGADVCVSVANPHPVNYRYSLDAVVDTFKADLPDLSVLKGFIEKLPGYVEKDATKQTALRMFLKRSVDSVAREEPPKDDPNEKLRVLFVALRSLSDEVDTAKSAAEQSDIPEAFDKRDGSDGGFRAAVKRITGLPKDKFHFNDPKLKENFDEELKKAREWADTNTSRKILAAGLAASTTLLLTARDKLRTDYSASGSEMTRLCKAVAAGRNTITLAIAKAGDAGKRDTYAKDDKGTPPVQIVVDSRYQRKFATLDALTLGVFASDVPKFGIHDDTLRIDEREDPTNARPALLLNMNVWNFGPADMFGLGFGPGVGFSGKNIVSDLFGGVTLSFRDILRFGAGVGRSSQPKSVKGAEVNKHIPENFGAIADAIENGSLNSKAWYLLLTIPGLSLGGK